MRDAILSDLEVLEQREGLRVLYACESGSRAWGFESEDSDYDVRFIYVRPLDWYLSIDDRRDVIECTPGEGLDFSGWDVRKALRLFRKSNPPLLEWLRSPIVYVEQSSLAARLRELVTEFFSSRACLHHYLHMAEGNYREYLRGDEVRLKKYLYVLRPLLACAWIETHGRPPPMEFEHLLRAQRLEAHLAEQIEHLLRSKRAGEELTTGSRIPCVNQFIETAIEHFTTLARSERPSRPPDSGLLDRLFRDVLREAWA